MREHGDKPKVSEVRHSDWGSDVPRYKYHWLADVLKSSYGPQEKSTVRKAMVPVSSIIKLWKRIFR